MADWKDALQALTGNNEDLKQEKDNNKKVDKKHRQGVVFSTNPNFSYNDDIEEEIPTLPHNQQKLRLSIEKAGRAGKIVTIVRGFIGTTNDLNQLAKLLKQHCGVGGSVKDGDMIIQGDHKQKLLEMLKKEGYTQTK